MSGGLMDGADGGAAPTLLIARLHIGGIHLDDLAVEFGRSLRHPTGRSHWLGHPTHSFSAPSQTVWGGFTLKFLACISLVEDSSVSMRNCCIPGCSATLRKTTALSRTSARR